MQVEKILNTSFITLRNYETPPNWSAKLTEHYLLISLGKARINLWFCSDFAEFH